MRVDLFDFELPAELIALRPAKPRDSARLLVVDAERISDRAVLDLPKLLRPGDVLVFNNTRVIPAQLEGRRGAASIGATLHKREGPREWWAFVRNAKRVRDGDIVEFGGGVSASAVKRDDEGAILFHFHGSVHRLPPSCGPGGSRRLPDHVRAGGRGGCGSDGRSALHAEADRGAGEERCRPRDADPARGSGDVPPG